MPVCTRMTPDPKCVAAMIHAYERNVDVKLSDGSLDSDYHYVTLNAGPYDGIQVPMQATSKFVSISVTFDKNLVAMYGDETERGVHFIGYRELKDLR